MILHDEVISQEELLEKIDPNEIEWAKTRKGKYWYKYANVECAFDTEVSSFYSIDEQKHSLLYIWQFGYKGWVTVGRTIPEFVNFMKKVSEKLELSYTKILPIYVHNLSYDFQFIYPYYTWDLFAREGRHPFKAKTNNGLEFRCSYMLSGLSLSMTAKQLTKHKVEKRVGDLDYRTVRTPLTELTKKELDYCIYDVLVIMALINEELEHYGSITKIPMTNTGKVREFCRDICFNDKNKKEYRNLIKCLRINTVDEYLLLKRAFQGGFTHANFRNANKVWENVASYDFTSSYPAVFLSEKFPMSAGILRYDVDIDEIENDNENYAYIFNIELTNVREKENIPEHYLSAGNCHCLRLPKTTDDIKKGTYDTLDNGRVVTAKKLQTTMTDVDWWIVKQCYDFDTVRVGQCYVYQKAYLPKPFIECILDLYKAKTELKGVDDQKTIYQLKKGMLNSMYGASVTDIASSVVEFNPNGDDVWKTTINMDNLTNLDAPLEKPYEGKYFRCNTKRDYIMETLEDYNNSRNRFLYYPWGIFCTAYARRNLWKGILEFGQDYIYSDTDSLKVMNYKNHIDFIENYNKEIELKLQKMCDRYKLLYESYKPKTIKGVEKVIGVWDFEGVYKRFKTLGAKRYMVEHEENETFLKGTDLEFNSPYEITVSGINKVLGNRYLTLNFKDPFIEFTDNMVIPAESSGRMVSTYIDESFAGTVYDYQKIPYNYNELSGLHMEESSYHLSMSPLYLAIIGGVEYQHD